MGRVLTMVAAAALAVNVVTFGVQGADLASIENSYLTAAELVPSYGLMVCAFGVLGMAGIGLDAVELWPRRVRLSVGARRELPCSCWPASSSCGSRST